MKKLLLLLTIIAFAAVSAYAVETLNFSPGQDGNATFSNGIITFNQPVEIDNLPSDYHVFLPELEITSAGGGIYTATPVNPTLSVKDASNNVLFSGSLGIGDAVAFNTTAVAYTVYQIDVIWDPATYNTADAELLEFLAPNSAGLAMSFDTDAGLNFKTLFDNGYELPQDFNFSGSLASKINPVPAPGAFLLGGIGATCVGWIKRRRAI